MGNRGDDCVLARDSRTHTQVWYGELNEGGKKHCVAVKKYPSAWGAEEMDMFRRETGVLFLAAMRCHNVCKVYGTTFKDGKLCIVMKLYKESMGGLMRRSPGGKLLLVIRPLWKLFAALVRHYDCVWLCMKTCTDFFRGDLFLTRCPLELNSCRLYFAWRASENSCICSVPVLVLVCIKGV